MGLCFLQLEFCADWAIWALGFSRVMLFTETGQLCWSPFTAPAPPPSDRLPSTPNPQHSSQKCRQNYGQKQYLLPLGFSKTFLKIQTLPGLLPHLILPLPLKQSKSVLCWRTRRNLRRWGWRQLPKSPQCLQGASHPRASCCPSVAQRRVSDSRQKGPTGATPVGTEHRNCQKAAARQGPGTALPLGEVVVPTSGVRTFAGFETSFDPFCSVGGLSHTDRVRQVPEVNTNTPASSGERAFALFCIHTSEHFIPGATLLS